MQSYVRGKLKDLTNMNNDYLKISQSLLQKGYLDYGMSGLRAYFAAGNEYFLNEIGLRGLTFPVTGLTNFILNKIIGRDDFIEQIREKGFVRLTVHSSKKAPNTY